MKKKLIAIVASLAMVATMVPATAFGAAATNGGFKLDTITSDSLDGGYKALRTAGNEANIEFGTRGSVITVDGVIPWAESLPNYSTTTSLQKGNYLGLELEVPAQNNGNDWFAKVDGLHTLKNDTEARTTDLVRLTPSDSDIMLMRVEPKVYTFDYYALADTVEAGGAAITGKNHIWFKTSWTDAEKYEATGNYANHAYGTTAELTAMLRDATKATLTCDATNLTLLNAKDTRDLNEFVDAVAVIEDDDILDVAEDNTVDAAYKRAVIAAQSIYDALTDDQKAVINKAPLKEDVRNYKKALEALETAQKNVEGNKAAEQLIEDINALPTLPATAFTDKAAIEAAYAPMVAAEKDYNALTTTQKAVVTNYATLTTYRTDYDRLIKAYVDPIYAEASAIDLEQPLSTENVALITELKAYVDGEYIDTANIATFTQAKYDALMEALNKVAKDEASLENATIAAIADQVYTGAAIEPAVTVTDKAGKEVSADDYTVIYSNNKDAGTATVTVAAKSSGAYTGSVSATFTITPATLTDAMVNNIANVTYTGRAITPAISAASGVTYTVAYRNNTAVGKATATITGTGNYTGTITKNFIVRPAKEAISSLKAGKKRLTVAYKAQTGARYRIVYSPAKGQAKAVNTTATQRTIKSLKAGRTYKVKVRAYKVIDGTTYNGTYSAVKKVKVK